MNKGWKSPWTEPNFHLRSWRSTRKNQHLDWLIDCWGLMPEQQYFTYSFDTRTCMGLYSNYHELFENIWETVEIPEKWSLSYIIKLPKKSDLSNCQKLERNSATLQIPMGSIIYWPNCNVTGHHGGVSRMAFIPPHKLCGLQEGLSIVNRNVLCKVLRHCGIPIK